MLQSQICSQHSVVLTYTMAFDKRGACLPSHRLIFTLFKRVNLPNMCPTQNVPNTIVAIQSSPQLALFTGNCSVQVVYHLQPLRII